MSRAAFALEADAVKSSSARMSSGVRVSKPGDSHEVEADRVADTVVRGGSMPGWSLAAKGFDGILRKPAESHADPEAQVEHALQASAEGRAAIAQVTAGAASAMTVTGAAAAGVVAALAAGRKGAAGAGSIALDGIHPGLSVKVTHEGGAGGAEVALNYAPKTEGKHAGPEKKAGPKLVRKPRVKETPHAAHDAKTVAAPKPAGTHDAGKKEELTVHRKAERAEPMYTGSAEVDSVLRSPGQELEPATRREMESRIGFDFGRVRLHTDARAGESAQGLSARAYTVGSDVVFAPGRYAPQTTEGRHLLAHELTHVVQQTGGAQRTGAAGLHVAKPAPRVVQRSWSGRDLPGVGWLLDKIHELPGYKLFSFVIGKDLIEDRDVDRNAWTLVEALLQLLGPFGDAIFARLKSVGKALELAYQWLLERVHALGLTEDYFSDLLSRAWDAVSGWHPIRSWERIKEIAKEPLDKLSELAREIINKVEELIVEAALEAFGDTGRKVWAFFKKAANVIGRIVAHPVQFAENLFSAVVQGFKTFGQHILTHLGEGFKKWIFEELHIKGVTMPADFTFGSMLKLILQVLGLTYEQRRPQLVEKLGEPVVDFFETSGKVLTRVKNEGFTAIKEMILEKANSIYDSVVTSLRDWVTKEIVERGIDMVAKLASPVGEFIQAVESIYETIKFIIDKASDLGKLIDSVLDALSDIVDGTIAPAAQRIEDALADSIPLLLRFIAGQLHIEGIGKSIRDIIDKIRQPIDNVIGKVLDFIVEKAKPIWEAGKAAFMERVQTVKDWWTKPEEFRLGNEKHEITVEGEGDHPEVFVHSDKSSLEHFLDDVKATKPQKRKILALAKKLKWSKGALQTRAKDEEGYKTYQELRAALEDLKVREAPKQFVKEQTKLSAQGGGKEADAFVTGNRDPGTEPGGPDPEVWEDLGETLRKKKSYVRGHLLSMRLGGLGVWPNMMPITNKINQRMNAQVEAPLKRATANPNRAFHYVVKAEYKDTVLDPLPAGATKKERTERANAAEQRLVSLTWTTKPAEFDVDTGKWKEVKGDLWDEAGNAMSGDVASGGFTPPTLA
jgi:Domain of unknown function (DUF4157)/DNA/RNA non-specific endonuclease